MCGIAGLVDFSNKSNKDILTSMSDSLSHRGPDGGSFEFIENEKHQVGLAHRRLSIIDLSNGGKQPMQYQNLWITFNGEIYNYQEIKNELILLNHQFNSTSDTEVVLHAIKEWGLKAIDKFIGMFAFVIYNTELNILTCVRDRAGVKPFFYYHNTNLFLFASELKAFHKHPGFEKELDVSAVKSFMQFGNIPAPYSIFKNCFKLPPAHILELDLTSQTLTIQKYWNVYDAYNKPKLKIDFETAKQETEKVISSAFQYRMVADVPVGLFLSGGYDSSCLASLLQKDRLEKLKTYTISVPDIGLDEGPYAKDIAAHLGTEHHQYSCTQSEAIDLIHDLPYYYDEPFADSSAIPTMLVCKMARKDVTVALSADAGDEVFAGYNRYDYVIRYGNRLNKIPSTLKSGVAKLMHNIPANAIPYLKSKYNFANRYEKVKNILKDSSIDNIMSNLNAQFSKHEMEQLFNKSIINYNNLYSSKELEPTYFTALNYMMAIDYQTYLPDDILQKVDRASMAFSLEAREPFLDHRVVEFAAQLPDEYKYNNGVKKHIIREITHQYIPSELLNRPKMGFAIPIENWLENDLKESLIQHLSETELAHHGLFNVSYISKLLKDFLAGKKEYGVKLWYILMFQMWYVKWMKN